MTIQNQKHMLQEFYIFLRALPRIQGISLLCSITILFICCWIVLWCIIFSAFLGAPLQIFKSISVYDFTAYTLHSWIELYRIAWLASAAEYGFAHDFGPIPAYILYLNTLKYSALYYPNIVVYNLLLVLYTVRFSHCFGVMLYGLIMQKPKVSFKISAWTIIFRMLVVLTLLVLFVWCPPVFGFGVPANFETGDPLNPIDWSKLDLDCVKNFLPFLTSILKKKIALSDKRLLIPRQSPKRVTLKMILILIIVILLLLLGAICFIYWLNPEWIDQIWDLMRQSCAYKAFSFLYRVMLGFLEWFIKRVIPTKTSYHSVNEESSSSSANNNNKPSSWFSGWWQEKNNNSSSIKGEDFVGTMANKAQNTSDQCDQTLKQRLTKVEKEPLTPRRDAIRKDHAWEIHKECKEKVNVYFDILQEFGGAYKGQTQQTQYSGSYDLAKKKVEIKYDYKN